VKIRYEVVKNCFPAQNRTVLLTEKSVYVVCLNYFERLLDFFMSFVEKNSNAHNFLLNLSNNPSRFLKILRTLSGETRILGRKIPLKDRYHATILYTRIYKEFDSAQYNIFSSLVSFLKITI